MELSSEKFDNDLEEKVEYDEGIRHLIQVCEMAAPFFEKAKDPEYLKRIPSAWFIKTALLSH